MLLRLIPLKVMVSVAPGKITPVLFAEPVKVLAPLTLKETVTAPPAILAVPAFETIIPIL